MDTRKKILECAEALRQAMFANRREDNDRRYAFDAFEDELSKALRAYWIRTGQHN